ncbi:MAG: periplasmic heavy metal sensor [Asticcacaulis sp.]|uniref:periplasmic heavy metal sensor n=1 Tax=Asticcacaulis sp. TaxID=1872648 RepID=UPI0039E560BF
MGSWLTDTRLKWILGVSLVLNIFLIAAAIGAGFVVKRNLRDFQRPLAMQKAWRDATAGTTDAERHHIYAITKAAVLTGEADMLKARALRSQARDLTGKTPFDAAQMAIVSEQARNAENDARGKIENALILNTKELSVRERAFVLGTLLRPSGRYDRFIQDRPQPPVAQPSPNKQP